MDADEIQTVVTQVSFFFNFITSFSLRIGTFILFYFITLWCLLYLFRVFISLDLIWTLFFEITFVSSYHIFLSQPVILADEQPSSSDAGSAVLPEEQPSGLVADLF